uniref:Uncharacterized protein n=1 Tax=Timema bartmani TaxID=61472 RepID=A0A7R9F1C6_9NEOP|nr:unnamed protein product [Timema bartmani]
MKIESVQSLLLSNDHQARHKAMAKDRLYDHLSGVPGRPVEDLDIDQRGEGQSRSLEWCCEDESPGDNIYVKDNWLSPYLIRAAASNIFKTLFTCEFPMISTNVFSAQTTGTV